jgi:uncharacterized protein (TIGR02145 family)
MTHARLIPLLAAAAALLFSAGCSDSMAPAVGLVPEAKTRAALPTVATSYLTAITFHDAVGGGEVVGDGGAAVTARGVVWSMAPNPTLDHGRTNDGAGTGQFTSRITGLQGSGTTYYARAYATNSEGTAYGVQRAFRTSQGTVSDNEGNVYEIVKIGDQWWMAENLRVTRYRNGDEIPTNLSNHAWENATHGASAIYPHAKVAGLNSDAEVVAAYGLLYNWFTVEDPRGICPDGWRVPSNGDWEVLAAGLAPGVGNRLKSDRTHPASHPRWNAPNNATNETAWSGVPGGRRLFQGDVSGMGNAGNWLSRTQYDRLHSWSRILSGDPVMSANYSYKQNGNSVRCLRDDGGAGGAGGG